MYKIPEVNRFCIKGIDPESEEKLHGMFFNTTITGDTVWASFESTKISTTNSILVEEWTCR